MIAIVFGASGGLARALIRRLLCAGWRVDAVCRAAHRDIVDTEFSDPIAKGALSVRTVCSRYTEFTFGQSCDALFLTQALFEPRALCDMHETEVCTEIEVGLMDPVLITRSFLHNFPPKEGARRNICFIGSTSAYAGFKNTSVYCAVKHGLLGFMKAMNDEYSATDDRFWLFSMGTMRTDMGMKVTGQDASTYLEPDDVAERIVSSISHSSNVFEPEVMMRRRIVKLL